MEKEVLVPCSRCQVAGQPRITRFPSCVPWALTQVTLLCQVVLSCPETCLYFVIQQCLNQHDIAAMELFQLMFMVGTYKQTWGRN